LSKLWSITRRKDMKRNGFILFAAAALVLAALALPPAAAASCVYIDGCTYCVNDGGCCMQTGPCGCYEFQCRASAPPQGFAAVEESTTTDWWSAVVRHDQGKAQPIAVAAESAESAGTAAR
jgi:hypothetical protein